MTTVSDIMTSDVRSLSPSDSVVRAARTMADLNVGVIPVCEVGRLVGVLTDRDIAVRCVAQGLAAEHTPLSAIMTGQVQCCFGEEELGEVMGRLGDAQIRRLPVVDRGNRLVGILSLGDIAVKTEDKKLASVLQDISEPAAVSFFKS